ncbi:MAG: SCO family protein [Anaerolineae bacterium]|nr:SCO family protein [Anaerolineae bacterium]
MKKVLSLAFLLLLLGCQFAAPHEFAGLELTAPQPAPNFTLESADGPVQLSDYQGKFVFLYFGYTFCPDACPTTMTTLAQLQRQLGDDADQVQVIMITIDPERDTAENMAEYVAFFDDSFVGLTGEKAEIDAAGAPFGVYYEKEEGSAATGYLMSHTTRVYLLDREQNARVAYALDADVDAIAADIQFLLNEKN